MKNVVLVFAIMFLISCKSETNNKSLSVKDSTTISSNEPVDEKIYLDLGGELQYIEITSSSKRNPILLFIHGGPAWPQTPQLRYYNSDLAKRYTLVIWEQRGAGQSYKKNPNPKNVSLSQITKDGHQLTTWLKDKYTQEKVYLAGYSWGSLIGINLIKEFPEDYKAYIGISQIVNMKEGMKISNKWLQEQAIKMDDTKSLTAIDSLKNVANYEDNLDRFFAQWQLLNKYNGAVFNHESDIQTEKAMAMYEDYKDYDWFKVWNYSAKKLQADMFGANLLELTEIDIPIYLIQGRHDWNIPSVLAEKWFANLKSPDKEIYWFEQSGHGPLEEEPQEFNKVMIKILDKIE